MENRQIADTILMVRPASFGFNAETAVNNAFQQNSAARAAADIQAQAVAEFDELVRRLQAVGVQVIVAADTPTPAKTDAVFPNNWVSFHQDGNLVLYPMFSPTRRLERQEAVLQTVLQHHQYPHRLDFTAPHEAEGRFLEGTGSLILDRPNRLAYACRSQRTHPELLAIYCQKMGYEPVLFNAADPNGLPIYHTNVMMALGETFAVVCLDAIADPADQARLVQQLNATDKHIISLRWAQVARFAGNMLQVRSQTDGAAYLVMSEQARRSLDDDQIAALQRHSRLLSAPIPTIEYFGGGSVRCMMAEVFY